MLLVGLAVSVAPAIVGAGADIRAIGVCVGLAAVVLAHGLNDAASRKHGEKHYGKNYQSDDAKPDGVPLGLVLLGGFGDGSGLCVLHEGYTDRHERHDRDYRNKSGVHGASY